jgi:CheY-like chemotaxis protein
MSIQPGRRKPRILVVDDEAALTRMMKLTLEACGRYEVITENFATDAVATARTAKPDLILLDVMMPDKDGGEVAAELRAHQETAHVPVVFLTAAVQEGEVRDRGGLIGGLPFLAKPVGKDELIAVIERHLPG